MIEQECFGGVDADHQNNDWLDDAVQEDKGSKSAYMLVYERVSKKDPFEFSFKSEDQKNEILKTIRLKKDAQVEVQDGSLFVDFYGIDKKVSI